MKSSIRAIVWLMLAAGALAGFAWLRFSVDKALHYGDWSDASRQWEVCQYVKAKINPYELAFRLLRDTFGPATGPNRVLLREQHIYSISMSNWNENTPGLLPGHPPPEATYPPSTMSMLLPTIGFLPKPVLLRLYTAANLVFLALLISILTSWFQAETRLAHPLSLALVAMLCLLWSPLQYVIANGQAGILALLCAVAAIRLLDRAPLIAGALFMVSLIKPSMVLLYFFIPLVQWKWKPLWTTFFLGVILTLLPSFWLHEWPWVMISQWMGLCRYVLQGAFTLQEVLNAIGWENTMPGTFVVLLLWGSVLSWCARYRRSGWEVQFAFLSLANLAWTYHERHDFVLLAFLLVIFAAQLVHSNRRAGAIIGLGLCLILGLALSDRFYVPAESWAHALRWAGRAALIGLWGLTAAGVRRSHLEKCARPIQSLTA
jgi:hypothetical protein